MGLDMYLSKVKRSKKGNDLEEILKVDRYLSWLDRGKKEVILIPWKTGADLQKMM